MDRLPLVPRPPATLELALWGAITAFAMCAGIWAAQLCTDVLQHMARPLLEETIRATGRP